MFKSLFLQLSLLTLLILGLTSCSLSTLISNLTSQNMETIISKSQSSDCETIDIDELRGLVSELSGSIFDIFGLESAQIESLLSSYESEDRSSLCLWNANLSGSTTHQAYFFTTDSNYNTDTWLASEISITETLSDDSTNNYTATSITRFSDYLSDPSNTSFSFSVVMDYSGSMSSSDLSALETALNTLYSEIPANYRSEIIKFSSSASLFQEYTDDTSLLSSAVLDQNITRGSTALNDGMYEGLTNTSDETASIRFIIAFTDGLENSSSHSQSEVVSLAQTNHIPIIIIGMGSIVDIAGLMDITNDTGGFFLYAADNSSLSSLFNQIEDYLDNTYVVTWTSSDTSGVTSVSLSADSGTFTGTYTP